MKNESFILKIYSVTITVILGFILLSSFNSNDSNPKFDEITVGRINIVEPDGKLKMVISNQDRQHPGMIDGINHYERERPPGILFFNEEEDEIGGLSYNGNKEAGGNQLHLSYDQYKNDQVLHLAQYTKSNGDNKYGLQLWQRDKEITAPIFLRKTDSLEKLGLNYRQKLEALKKENNGYPILAPRLFVGKNYNDEAGLFIQDKNGIDRLRIYVDSSNQPKIEVLDEKGDVLKDF